MSLFGNKNQNSQTAVPAVPNQKTQKKQGKKPQAMRIRTVQELLDFDGITKEGVILKKGYYSKLYELVDSNFVTEPD